MTNTAKVVKFKTFGDRANKYLIGELVCSGTNCFPILADSHRPVSVRIKSIEPKPTPSCCINFDFDCNPVHKIIIDFSYWDIRIQIPLILFF